MSKDESKDCPECVALDKQIDKDILDGYRRLKELSEAGVVDEFMDAIPRGLSVGDVMLLFSAGASYTLCNMFYSEDHARYQNYFHDCMTSSLIEMAKAGGDTAWNEGPTH